MVRWSSKYPIQVVMVSPLCKDCIGDRFLPLPHGHDEEEEEDAVQFQDGGGEGGNVMQKPNRLVAQKL